MIPLRPERPKGVNHLTKDYSIPYDKLNGIFFLKYCMIFKWSNFTLSHLTDSKELHILHLKICYHIASYRWVITDMIDIYHLPGLTSFTQLIIPLLQTDDEWDPRSSREPIVFKYIGFFLYKSWFHYCAFETGGTFMIVNAILLVPLLFQPPRIGDGREGFDRPSYRPFVRRSVTGL